MIRKIFITYKVWQLLALLGLVIGALESRGAINKGPANTQQVPNRIATQVIPASPTAVINRACAVQTWPYDIYIVAHGEGALDFCRNALDEDISPAKFKQADIFDGLKYYTNVCKRDYSDGYLYVLTMADMDVAQELCDGLSK